MGLENFLLAWSNEAGGSVALFVGSTSYLMSPATAQALAFDLCRALATPDAAAALLGDLPSRTDLLMRVQAIGTPLRQALLDSGNGVADADLPDISRDLVALTMRRLLALCGDIQAGLFAADPIEAGEN